MVGLIVVVIGILLGGIIGYVINLVRDLFFRIVY